MDVLDRYRLDGRVALVTGAGRGLGADAAETLAALGADVILMSRTSAEIEAVAATIVARGGRARALPCSVTDDAAVRAAISGLPRLDILINNAGTNFPEPFLDVSDDHLDALLAVNLRAPFVVAQAAVRKMLEHPGRHERGGAIVNVSSQLGHVGAPNRSVYVMTKHGIEGFTKALAVELAPYNIRVNSIGPTFIATPMTEPFFADAAFKSSVLARIPLGRMGELHEVSAAIAFLASPASSLVTGAGLVADGGWTAQ